MQYLAQDIMSRNVITAKPDMSCEELQDLLILNKITGVPVVDGKKSLVGVITMFDVLNTGLNTVYSPDYCESVRIEQVLEQEGFHLEMPNGGFVSDFMTRDVITACPSTSIEELANLMYNHRIHRVIIVEPHSHKVLGIVTTFDLMKLVKDGILSNGKSPEKTLAGARNHQENS